MKSLAHITNIYFIGIGGIGMSALARYCRAIGKQVSGYDKTATRLTAELQQEGIPITFSDSLDVLPNTNLKPEESMIVYTPAIPASHKQLVHFKETGYNLVKRAELLGLITAETTTLAVAGTHGKTTTSAILGHLLAACEAPVTAFLGGIAENYNSNLIQKGSEIAVVEADEFDRSFMKLSPNIACVTSMDADHLDIYGSKEELELAFKEFAALIPKDGALLHPKGLPLNGLTVGIEDHSDFEAKNIRIENGAYTFDLKAPDFELRDLRFALPGHHNLLNAITALGMAIKLGTPTDCLPKALFEFKGVRRRFSYRIKREDYVLIDDYAHHPSEINAVHQAVSEFYPEREKLVVFQPHLFSRTQDFAQEFADSLSQFNEVLLLDIYPAREAPIPGVDSAWLLSKINCKNKALVSKVDLCEAIKKSVCKVVLLLGAGDIGELVSNLVIELDAN